MGNKVYFSLLFMVLCNLNHYIPKVLQLIVFDPEDKFHVTKTKKI